MDVSVTRCPDGGLAEWTADNWDKDALVFIGSCGIAVRAVAPHVKSKTSDPAVIVIDELGTFVISLLSGHLGGANELALRLAEQLSALPVITTATDINGVFALDSQAKAQGMKIANPDKIKSYSSALLNGAKPPLLRLSKPEYVLGIGCRKGISAEAIEKAVDTHLSADVRLSGVCSIDIKANEAGLVEFCRRRSLPLITFSAQELMSINGEFMSSERVLAVTGADNICERAAVLGSGGTLILRKQALDGVTLALAQSAGCIEIGDPNE
jgi:cobalt-precorrin 5A hydrolase